ncbi:hypothetical protein [Limosilactobacillus equigenerosi]|uniref:hypothetical protein n=2 Tax=Limosilactobacillus equigenerosi TaxID=417373 RepID=UPI0006D01060|nr:hypothetical protein [Limosilactobacillus equigenerosi]
MSKRRIILSILIGLVVIWGVSGMFITKRHAEQQAVQESNEERRVQQKCAEYLVHHYEGIKTLEVSRLYKPNSIGGGTYSCDIRINGKKEAVEIGQYSKKNFDKSGPDLLGWPDDFPESYNIIKRFDANRSLSAVSVTYDSEKSKGED